MRATWFEFKREYLLLLTTRAVHSGIWVRHDTGVQEVIENCPWAASEEEHPKVPAISKPVNASVELDA
jgi:hypothetical protein